MKKIIDRIIDFYEGNKDVLGNIFFIIIPFIIAIIGGTLGYVDKGFLGALAGFIRFGIYYYAGCFAVFSICYGIYEHRYQILIGVVVLVIGFIIWLLNWLLTNY